MNGEKESLLPRLPSTGENKSFYFMTKTKSQTVCLDPLLYCNAVVNNNMIFDFSLIEILAMLLPKLKFSFMAVPKVFPSFFFCWIYLSQPNLSSIVIYWYILFIFVIAYDSISASSMEPVAEADEKSWWSNYFGGSGYQRVNSTHNAKPRKVRNRIIMLIYKMFS